MRLVIMALLGYFIYTACGQIAGVLFSILWLAVELFLDKVEKEITLNPKKQVLLLPAAYRPPVDSDEYLNRYNGN